MKPIEDFLLKNNFFKKDEKHFQNDKCEIFINHPYYGIYFTYINKPIEMFSNDLNIYWLVGVLTWYDLIDKNYKK